MDAAQALGWTHFLTQADGVAKALLVALLLMSLTTWCLIATKAVSALAARRRTAAFLQHFWDAPSMQSVATRLEEHHPDEPFSHLAWHAIVATRHHQHHGANRLTDAGTGSDFLTRAMRRVIDEETTRLESGLTLLASIGSTAPFIGLFGTVWGVYHALVSIGVSGQGTLDKVAGPVGEALIMTALGLAVAIPAVLAYNACVRSNRLVLGKLDAYAHDLFAFLTTGSHLVEAAPVTPLKATPAARGA